MRTFFWAIFLIITYGVYGSVNVRSALRKPIPNNRNFKVEWIGSFSSDQSFKNRKSSVSYFVNLLLGKNDLRLMKPVAVLSNTFNTFQVLDRGRHSLIQIDQNKANFKEVHSFPSAISLCSNKKLDLFFTDSQLNKVYIYEKNDTVPVVLNDTLTLYRPTGIAWSEKNKTLWVVETGMHRIVVLDEQGKVINYIGRRGKAAGEFNFPTYIWIDQNGMVYVVDAMNFRIQIFDSRGDFVSAFGQAGDASGYLGRPKGIATDSYGNIYVVDALFNTVQMFDKSGNFLNYFGRQGSADGEFWMPSGIYIDNRDKIFVADTYNARIQIFQLCTKENNGN